MARLKNINSGAIVSVPDEKVERLGTEWEAVAEKSAAAKKPAPKSSK